MDLFTPVLPAEKLHPIFQLLIEPHLAPERELLNDWAKGMRDRDGKFVKEFQSTFESSLWELYLHAATKALGLVLDQTHTSPDFVATSPIPFCIEATIAAPAKCGRPAFSRGIPEIPDDFGTFNAESSIRICNSFTSKVKRYREHYCELNQVKGKPFVLAIASYDRPLAHFAADRPIMAAMYGLYHDEAATSPDADRVVSYNVSAAEKSEHANVPMGMFCEPHYPEVSAVVYSSLATWGKVRALADAPEAKTVYQTIHPCGDGLLPTVRSAVKSEYVEDLFDGLFVLHNPFATFPLPDGVLSHPRIAEVFVAEDGGLIIKAPEDFLLVRMLWSLHEKITDIRW
jgi:hypothetical protein